MTRRKALRFFITDHPIAAGVLTIAAVIFGYAVYRLILAVLMLLES